MRTQKIQIYILSACPEQTSDSDGKVLKPCSAAQAREAPFYFLIFSANLCTRHPCFSYSRRACVYVHNALLEKKIEEISKK